MSKVIDNLEQTSTTQNDRHYEAAQEDPHPMSNELNERIVDGAFRFVDLFAGLGGFHQALEGLGGQVVFAAEWKPTLNTLYTRNYGLQPWSDINDLDSDAKIAREVPDHEVLAAGFPCQPFSKAGDQLGFADTSQGHLFFKVHDILRVKRPRRFILENVPNIRRHDDGHTERIIIANLKDLGYNVEVNHFSPHELGIPQIRDRAYFIGSLDSLNDYHWPAKSLGPTHIADCLLDDVVVTRHIPELTQCAIDMWGDFLARSPKSLKLPSFPIWSMEFGATYPYESDTPPAVWARRPRWGLSNMGSVKGSFGFPLDGLKIHEQREHIPSHACRDGDLKFPLWKRTFIRQNREFYANNRAWIDPWMSEWHPENFPSSFQKFEWNAQGEERDIENFVLQIRASGIRVKRPTTAPSLVAFTETQVPILGANLAGERRYMTPRECANLQSLGDIELPTQITHAYHALGNAVNAEVVAAIARPLVADLTQPTFLNAPIYPLEHLGATA